MKYLKTFNENVQDMMSIPTFLKKKNEYKNPLLTKAYEYLSKMDPIIINNEPCYQAHIVLNALEIISNPKLTYNVQDMESIPTSINKKRLDNPVLNKAWNALTKEDYYIDDEKGNCFSIESIMMALDMIANQK